MSAHTPGAWGVFDPATRKNATSERRILVTHPDGYRIIADCSTGYCTPSGAAIPVAQRVANAHLLAAAPDLLAALIMFLDEYANGLNGDDPDRNARPEVIAARAAIAKAKCTP